MPGDLAIHLCGVLFHERHQVDCQMQEVTLELVGLGLLDLLLGVVDPIQRQISSGDASDPPKLVALNRVDDAQKQIEEAQANKFEGDFLHLAIYLVAFMKKDAAEMDRQVAWASGKPGTEDLLLSFQSDTKAYYGELTRRENSRGAPWMRQSVPTRTRPRACGRQAPRCVKLNLAMRRLPNRA